MKATKKASTPTADSGTTVCSGTIRLQDALSRVRTALETYVGGFKPNATYKVPPEISEYMQLPIVKALTHALTGERYYIVGPPGIGKTSHLRTVGQALGYDVIIINAANLSIENLQVPFPVWNETLQSQVLKPLIYGRFLSDKPKLIFIDEIGRADAGLANTLMELLQEGTLCGNKIPNLATVMAADNPQGQASGRLVGLDFSQASRFSTVELDAKSTPWRRALAEEFETIDLTKVFSVYDTLDDKVREVLNPRVLAFAIRALTNGFPGIYALPIISGARRMLLNTIAVDVTTEVFDRLATALGTTNREVIPDVVERAIAFALKYKQNIYLQGAPGIGKTASIKAALTKLGVRYHYDSAAVLSPEDLNVPFPSQDGVTLDLLPAEKFADPEDWMWIVDEICRGTRRTQNALMEPIQERTVGGIKTNMIATIALNNPREIAGMKLDVGKNDLAQASRFALSIEIDASNINWGRYLKDTYGEDVATPFIEWWEDDIDDLARTLANPRVVEKLIGHYEAGNDLKWGIPFVNGEYVKVPLVDLHARLEKRPLARLKAIVADVDRYEEELLKGKDEASTEHSTVFWAFYKADVTALKEVRAVCCRLFAVLDRQHRIDLIRQGAEKQRFWNGVLLESSAPLDNDEPVKDKTQGQLL